MKRIKISKLLPREIKATNVVDGFCPQEIICAFFNKYSVEKSGVLLYHMQMFLVYGRERIPASIQMDDTGFHIFRKELEELLKAVYLEYQYNRQEPIKFVEKGGRYD